MIWTAFFSLIAMGFGLTIVIRIRNGQNYMGNVILTVISTLAAGLSLTLAYHPTVSIPALVAFSFLLGLTGLVVGLMLDKGKTI